MKRKPSMAIIAIFLIQCIAATQGLSSETLSLIPQTRVDINNPDICFQGKYGIINQALFIYKLDVNLRCRKEAIKKEYESSIYGLQQAWFDIENIDIGKRGWTRYYPFTANGQNLTVRIFLTSERPFQADLQVFLEGSINNPAVTFQVVPSINDLLKEHKIKPHRISAVAYNATKTSL